MNQFVFIKPFSFYEKFKKKQNIENSAQKKVSTRSRGISYSETLTCKENKLSKKVDEYINCLPTSFVKDQDAPPPFSYSWLQRIGRMDIFSEKIENKTSEGNEFSSYDFFKTDPIFRLPKKKKKKLHTRNFDLIIGKKKEEKIVMFQNKKVHKDTIPVTEKKEKKKETFNSEIKKPKITILEVSSFDFSNILKYLISFIITFLGFFLGYTF